ncbi:MAG: ferritin-like domain-containing protein [Promethearchaeota archaeon]|jgi:bacterioferritin
MEKVKPSQELFKMLNDALARELKVSVLYMLQHAIWNGKTSTSKNELKDSKPKKFVATHWPIYLPGISLKKTAITEMRHAERIAERITLLGEEIIREVPAYIIGESPKEILEIDKNEEASAIELYTRIIEMARKEGDEITVKMFKKILSDEEGHYKNFSNLLESV